MLQLVDIAKSFGGRVVLQRMSLEIPVGKTTALLGPSGCGKSTLLRVAAGLIAPDEGRVIFDGEELTQRNLRQMRRKLGFVLQDGGLFPHLTGRGNAGLLAKHLGWNASDIETRVMQLADLTRLPHDVLGRYPHQMSGGQRQRVGIMRALMLEPEVILLDEPMGALDPLVRYDLQNDLKMIFQTLKKTVLLVTHDLGEADFLGDDVVLLKDGRIIQQGTLDDLANRPQDPFVTDFIRAQRIPQWQ
jgi:osmoprotectant transport system ATP-binding protein